MSNKTIAFLVVWSLITCFISGAIMLVLLLFGKHPDFGPVALVSMIIAAIITATGEITVK